MSPLSTYAEVYNEESQPTVDPSQCRVGNCRYRGLARAVGRPDRNDLSSDLLYL
jgi:hypothetical protein